MCVHGIRRFAFPAGAGVWLIVALVGGKAGLASGNDSREGLAPREGRWPRSEDRGLASTNSGPLPSHVSRVASPPRKSGRSDAASTELAPTNDASLLAVAPPPFSKDIFPCSECHKPDDKVNRAPHAVDAHEDIVFEHDAKNRWCLDCHDAQQRDNLRLASGALLDFRESFKLCGQCHGDKLRDWKAGEHGKRTGSWDGQKQYLLCVHCHNPHSPRFKPMKPLPPPERPEPFK